MSRHHIKVPIYGLTTQETSQRRMALYRNVRPVLVPSWPTATALRAAEQVLVQRGALKPGDTYAITCGNPWGTPAAPTCSRSAASADAAAASRLPARCGSSPPRAAQCPPAPVPAWAGWPHDAEQLVGEALADVLDAGEVQLGAAELASRSATRAPGARDSGQVVTRPAGRAGPGGLEP